MSNSKPQEPPVIYDIERDCFIVRCDRIAEAIEYLQRALDLSTQMKEEKSGEGARQ